MYLLAIIFPPLAVLLAGRPFHLVVKEHKEEKRFERLVRLQSHRPTDRS